MEAKSRAINCVRYGCLEDISDNKTELCLIYAGWERCNPGYTYGPNMRKSYVLHVVKKGRGTLLINNKKYEIQKGEAFIIRPHIKAWYSASINDPWEYEWVGFTGYKAEEYLNSAGFIGKDVVKKLSCLHIINNYVDEILDSPLLLKSDELRRNAILMMFFATLIDDYNKTIPSVIKKREYPVEVYVKHAAEYIRNNYNEKIRINELADYIGLNRSYLTSCFKNIMGVSPYEYLLEIRMNKAKKLLLETDYKINEIANMVGYTDQLAFSKAFKLNEKVSPKMYRKL